MDKTIIKFVDIEIKKQKLHQHKCPISTANIDINKIVVSNNFSFSKKKVLNVLLATEMLKK